MKFTYTPVYMNDEILLRTTTFILLFWGDAGIQESFNIKSYQSY